MDSVDFAGKRLLLASLLPDTGHLTPLFQVAVALKERGAEVLAIVPNEAWNFVGRFGFVAEYLGRHYRAREDCADQPFASGRASRLFICGPLDTRKYIVPLKANGLKKFNEFVDKTLKFSPDLVFVDTHLFEEA